MVRNWVWIILAVYAAGFLLFPPRVLLINDEERYVAQAVAFASGRLNIDDLASVGAPSVPSPRVASDYPPGTSLLQTPFVLVAGWRGAATLSVVALAVLVLLTRKLLEEYRLPTAAVLLAPAYPGTAFFGRVAMSDVPTAAVVALSLWLIARAERLGPLWSFWAGLSCGLCLLFREPVLILLAPFLARLLWSRRANVALILGGLTGVAARGMVSFALFGNPAYVRSAGYGFSLESVATNLPLYLVILLVLLPLGAITPFFYRGPRRGAIAVALGAYVLLFLAFDYNAWRDNGVLRGTLLAARYMIPAVPLFTLTSAEVCQRLYRRVEIVNAAYLRAAFVGFAAVVATEAFAIHVVAHRLEARPLAILKAIQDHSPRDVAVVMNEKVAGKYLSAVYARRTLIPRRLVRPSDLASVCAKHHGVSLVFLDRTDTELFRADARANERFLGAAKSELELHELYSGSFPPSERLHIVVSRDCRPLPPAQMPVVGQFSPHRQSSVSLSHRAQTAILTVPGSARPTPGAS